MVSPQLALSSNTVTLKPGIGKAGQEALGCGQAKGSGQDPPRHQAAGQAALQGTGFLSTGKLLTPQVMPTGTVLSPRLPGGTIPTSHWLLAHFSAD